MLLRLVALHRQPTAGPGSAKPDQHHSSLGLTPMRGPGPDVKASPHDSYRPHRRDRIRLRYVARRLFSAADPTGRGVIAPRRSETLTLLDPFSSGSEATEFDTEVARLSHGALRIRVVSAKDQGPANRGDRDPRDAGRPGRPGVRGHTRVGRVRREAAARADAPLLIDNYRSRSGCSPAAPSIRCSESCGNLDLVGIGVLPGPSARPSA